MALLTKDVFGSQVQRAEKLLFVQSSADLGDEFSALLLFAIAFGFLLWQYISLRRMEEHEAVGVAGGE